MFLLLFDIWRVCSYFRKVTIITSCLRVYPVIRCKTLATHSVCYFMQSRNMHLLLIVQRFHGLTLCDEDGIKHVTFRSHQLPRNHTSTIYLFNTLRYAHFLLNFPRNGALTRLVGLSTLKKYFNAIETITSRNAVCAFKTDSFSTFPNHRTPFLFRASH